MKRIMTCCILAALIFAAGIAALFYTDKAADEIAESIRLIEDCCLKEDMEGARAAASKMAEEWESFRRLRLLTADSDHALEITMSAARITDMLQRENDEVLTECAVMAELIRVYKEEQLPNIMNVL
ncbi:MAG: DUF4363 family protein [Firmicutes bacterium]|nr:DUF4363 family protein [[Eubacterium] siraeum]MCM1488247.1 DUF4363 family protein [Bacillota bacterium]